MAFLRVRNQGAVITVLDTLLPQTFVCSGACWHDLGYCLNCVPAERGVCGFLASESTRLTMRRLNYGPC